MAMQNPTSGYMFNGNEKRILKKCLYSPVYCSIICKTWKHPKCLSVGEWIKKDVVYTTLYSKILLNLKEEKSCFL